MQNYTSFTIGQAVEIKYINAQIYALFTKGHRIHIKYINRFLQQPGEYIRSTEMCRPNICQMSLNFLCLSEPFYILIIRVEYSCTDLMYCWSFLNLPGTPTDFSWNPRVQEIVPENEVSTVAYDVLSHSDSDVIGTQHQLLKMCTRLM